MRHFGGGFFAAALAAAAAPAADAAGPFVLDRFIISGWVDPVVPPANFSAEYSRMRTAGLTALLGGFGATDPTAVRAQVAACAEAGLACIPSACETAAGPGPAGSCVATVGDVLGYQMYDEPTADQFPALAEWASSVAARAPGALRFINLLPNYGPFADEAAYSSYVAAFVATVKPDVLCFDHYPQWGAPPASAISPAGYLRNLATVREQALAATPPIRFLNFMNVMPCELSESLRAPRNVQQCAHLHLAQCLTPTALTRAPLPLCPRRRLAARCVRGASALASLCESRAWIERHPLFLLVEPRRRHVPVGRRDHDAAVSSRQHQRRRVR